MIDGYRPKSKHARPQMYKANGCYGGYSNVLLVSLNSNRVCCIDNRMPFFL